MQQRQEMMKRRYHDRENHSTYRSSNNQERCTFIDITYSERQLEHIELRDETMVDYEESLSHWSAGCRPNLLLPAPQLIGSGLHAYSRNFFLSQFLLSLPGYREL